MFRRPPPKSWSGPDECSGEGEVQKNGNEIVAFLKRPPLPSGTGLFTGADNDPF